MAYGGRSVCKIVTGKSEQSALRGELDACADIASGVTALYGLRGRNSDQRQVASKARMSVSAGNLLSCSTSVRTWAHARLCFLVSMGRSD